MKVLFHVTVDWYFTSHRLDLARALVREGAIVSVACQDTGWTKPITDAGVDVIRLRSAREDTSPMGLVQATRELGRLLSRLQPDILHNVALKPTVVGSLASLRRPCAVVNTIAGFGSEIEGGEARWRPLVLENALALATRKKRSATIVQNSQAMSRLSSNPFSRSSHIHLVRGSGIDTDSYLPVPEPINLVVGFAGRLLRDKGIIEFCKAAHALAADFPSVRFVAAGSTDHANPSSLTKEEVTTLSRECGVDFLGHTADMVDFYANANIIVLPSYHEGLPRVLLEAGALERPAVATMVPGCSEVILDGVTGMLVKVADDRMLAEAISRLLARPDLRIRYGRAARRRVVEVFSNSIVLPQTLDIYSLVTAE